MGEFASDFFTMVLPLLIVFFALLTLGNVVTMQLVFDMSFVEAFNFVINSLLGV